MMAAGGAMMRRLEVGVHVRLFVDPTFWLGLIGPVYLQDEASRGSDGGGGG